MFMITVIKCNSLSYVIFNAKMTLFDMSLLCSRVRVGVGLGQIVSTLHKKLHN